MQQRPKRKTHVGLIIVAILIPVLAVSAATWLVGTWSPQNESMNQKITAETPINNLDQPVKADQKHSPIAAWSDEIFNDPDSPVAGHPAGEVTIVEFFDYNCGYCRKITPTLTELKRRYPQLRFVYKELPILGSDSVFAASAALASKRQGKYVAFHKAMMQISGRITKREVMEIAQAVGLDIEQLRTDMEDPAIKDALRRNLELARAIGITVTPSLVIGDRDHVLRGAVDLAAIEGLIDQVRQERKGSQAINPGERHTAA